MWGTTEGTSLLYVQNVDKINWYFGLRALAPASSDSQTIRSRPDYATVERRQNHDFPTSRGFGIADGAIIGSPIALKIQKGIVRTNLDPSVTYHA